MVAIESMSCGVPIIGVAEGGLLETVIDGETGILTTGELTVKKVIEAVGVMTREHSLRLFDNCRKQAEIFSKKRFNNHILKTFI